MQCCTKSHATFLLRCLGHTTAVLKPYDFFVVFCRFYVQLPTETSHEFHDQMVAELEALENNQDIPTSVVTQPRSRLHPKVADKVRELVAGGETRLYAIRKFLRSVLI